VEVCAGAQVLAVEFDAALGDDGLEIGKCRKVGVHDRLVEHGPEVLGRLKLGCVAGQVDQPDPVRNRKVRFGVPAGLVQHEHDAALAAGRTFLGEGSKERGEERFGDAGGEIPDRLAREGLGEGRDVKPLVAVMAERDRALGLGRPDAAQDRLQAEAVFVRGPDLDREVGTARGLFGNDFVEFFLNVDSSSGVAAFG
jgi:hypothetical protein